MKARQHGITTLVDLFILDTVLFKPNISAEIIAHKKEDAEKIFERIVKFAWDNLPEWLKSFYQVDTDTQRTLKFSHGSSIAVSTSSRSGTLQLLHVSELGTMSIKYPEKAKEVMTGSLNAVHAGQIIFIESTAKGRDGHFYQMCKLAQKIQDSKKKLGLLDYKFFFFPWWQEPSYRLDDPELIIREHQEYFDKLVSKGIVLLDEQKWWYVKKSETQGDEMKSEFPSYPEEAFEASIEGAYFAKQMSQVRKDSRITRVPWDPRISVDTWWDIGYDDYNFIIFTQQVNKELRVIDCYENSQQGIVHYIKYLSALPYKYGKHTMPHDADSKSIQTGKSTKQIAMEHGLLPIFISERPNTKQSSIDQARSIFSFLWIDEVKCSRLITCLDNYRKRWNDKLGQWDDEPVHDEFSHGADAFQVLGSKFNPAILIGGDIIEQQEPSDPYRLFS